MAELAELTQSELALNAAGLDYSAGLIPTTTGVGNDGYLLDGLESFGL